MYTCWFLYLRKRYFLVCSKRFIYICISSPQVHKLCALAHIEVAPEGDSAVAANGLDVAAVQRDVGAMLRCMQTMRRGHDEEGGRPLEYLGRDAEAAVAGAGAMELELPEGEDGLSGPWGGAAKWAAPMQEVRVYSARSGEL